MPNDTTTEQADTTAAESTATPETPASDTSPAAGRAPTIEGDFDQDRAVALIAKLRGEVSDLKAKAAKTPSTSGAADEMADRVAALETRYREAEQRAARATVAAATGVPVELLTGDDEKSARAYADRLTAWADQRAGTAKERPGKELPVKPRTALTPGHGGDPAAEPFDPAAVARAARNR